MDAGCEYSYNGSNSGIKAADEKHKRDDHQCGGGQGPERGLPGICLAKELIILGLERAMETPVGE
jgi:hypothetical protein